ncbi:MAG: hypothetical protein ACRDTG_28490 [Pseudonocardiaceae bacterium]
MTTMPTLPLDWAVELAAARGQLMLEFDSPSAREWPAELAGCLFADPNALF